MSVYKEAIYALSIIERNSRRIYPDACDFGAPVKKGDEVWMCTKQLCDWYGVEGTRKVETYSTGTTVSQDVEYMPNEHNSSRYERARVVYVTTRGDRKMDGYIYIQK